MVRVIKAVPVSQIVVDRHPINQATLSLVDYLRAGGEVPPVKLARDHRGRYILRDGRHRVTAYKLLGRESIPAKFSTEFMRMLD